LWLYPLGGDYLNLKNKKIDLKAFKYAISKKYFLIKFRQVVYIAGHFLMVVQC
jgi:hypothetical protein